MILNLENFKCIKSFFIYCWNTELHGWTNKRKKVGCITSNPEILCQKFIELNKDYIIPKFNYTSKNDEIYPKKLLEINSLNLIMEEKNKVKKKYDTLCIKILHYLNSNEIENDITDAMAQENSPFNMISNLFSAGGENPLSNILGNLDPTLMNIMPQLGVNLMTNMTKYLTLLSLYFSNYPYLLNLLSIQEIKDLFQVQVTFNILINIQPRLIALLENLYTKIMENESILDEKDYLKELQTSLILLLSKTLRFLNIDPTLIINYYQIINFFRDIDFCLKFFASNYFRNFQNQNNNFVDEITLCLSISEPRYILYLLYCANIDNFSSFNEEEQKMINNSLTIKDFIVSGNNQFHQKIKKIEKNIKAKSIKYLNIEQISNYLEEKKKKEINQNQILTYFYFLIMKFEEFQANFEDIILLSAKTGITFLIFLYIENEENKKFEKIIINIIPTILIYSPEDIISYFDQKFKFNENLHFINLEQLVEINNIKIPKITFEQNEEDKYQDGCFELAETFDVNIIKNKFLFRIFNEIDYMTEFIKNIYNIYKKHNFLDLFYGQNCLYFGWKLYPELAFSPLACFAKRILYMYCREEKESQKSFYRIMNDDLRSRDSSKIYQYINLLAFINKFIEINYLANYKGKVFRATKLDENLILKLVTGSKMVNTTFWSTSKDFKVAENFMKRNNWRNSYIICNTFKNNIDIDFEQLNPFNEKEVLFLPFTEFRVEKIFSGKKYNKKIFIIEVTELGNRNFVNSDNMQVEDIKSLGENKFVQDFWKNNGKQFEEQFFKDIDFNEYI